MTRFGNVARRFGTATALVAAASFGYAAPAVAAPAAAAAAAQPSGCEARTYDFLYRVVAYCSSGTGEYRAYARCDRRFAPDYNRYGPWTRPGPSGVSKAQCDQGDRPFNGTYQTR
jgi:hypothetical protein